MKRLVLVRPAVEAGERLGFLPGDLAQKVDPYLRPLYDALYDLMGFDKTGKLFERGTIEIAPLAYMRGRTLNHSFIILDEAQNTTPEQMKMFLTRIGFATKSVITGDVTQIDLARGQKSGLVEADRILAGVRGIAFTRFTSADVVRHPLVQKIIDAYERDIESRKEMPAARSLSARARAARFARRPVCGRVGEASEARDAAAVGGRGRRSRRERHAALRRRREGRALNARYRGAAHPTNVLAFVYDESPRIEGDVVLCAPVLREEARAQGKALTDHCAHLVVHGMLHLQGYDHDTDRAARAMEARESAILAALGVPDPYARAACPRALDR